MSLSDGAFRAFVDAMDAGDFELLRRAVEARACRDKIGCGTLDEAASEFRPDPSCPSCGRAARRDGATPAGHRRFRCPACGRHFSALTGTVFENCKKDLATWVRFIEQMKWGAPLDGIAETCGISHQTAFEWRHRVFATVDGYQDRLVLRDRVWIDETYVNDTDLSHGYGEARKRGLSGRLLCVAVAIDVHKNAVAVVCGHGKPSSRRVLDALSGHVAEGSVVVHDMERAHGALVRERGCTSEAYRADVRDPVYLERMALVNNLCSWVKRYLWRYIGMDPANLQSYLNWYVYLFRVRQAKGRWPETARVVRHLMMTDATYRT